MSRIFRRGELKEAVVVVLGSLGEAHGYAIIAELKDRVGGGWKPSPGAIYPALLELVEMGHVRTADRDGTRIYSLTEAGHRAAEAQRSNTRWASLTARAEDVEEGSRSAPSSTASPRNPGCAGGSPGRSNES